MEGLDSRRVDERRPAWEWLWGSLGLLMLLELVLTVTRPHEVSEPVLADRGPAVRGAIERAREATDGWLLLGDSVLAGDVMHGHVPRWSEHRVLDYLRREVDPLASVRFEQVALDGLLPVDMLRLIYELDAIDPQGRVGVVLEINPRFFSAHYATQRACSREFLCDLGERPSQNWRWAWAAVVLAEAGQWLTDHLPIVRHRDRFPPWDSTSSPALLPRLASTEASDASTDPLMGRARVLEHYRALRVDRRSIQYRALVAIVDRLRTRGRRALVFATPLHDGWMADTLEGAAYGEYQAALDRIVNRPDDRRIRLISLDHPSLTDPLFLDHAHLRPEGNRWLAINILHQLGFGLAVAPMPDQLAYEEGPDRSLVTQVERADREGPPWLAAFNHPDGIAVSPGGGRVVVADTDNHCVRELVGPLTIVRTLAGQPRKRGTSDGPKERARLEYPRHPALVGDTVVVVDGSRSQRIRRIEGSTVNTLKSAGPQRWSRIDRLRSDGSSLWLIDHGTRILRVDPDSGMTRLRYVAPQAQLVALDVGPDGRLYFGDTAGQIWQLDPFEATPTLLFANSADTLLPQQADDYFPFTFEELALDRIVDLRYVDRYDAILVQDEHQVDVYRSIVSERIHLRLLSPREGKIYPWVHPIAHGGGYMFLNTHTQGLSSNVHRGSMALDPQSATLFYVERDRSRLLALGDGLWGTAKIGHHITPTLYGGFKDVFGLEAGRRTMLEHHPERWAHRRLEPTPRRGPYLGLLLGSSMTGLAEGVGQYSLGRLLERTLSYQLGVRDNIRFDLIQRSLRGPRLERLVSMFENFVVQQSPVDVVLFEVHSGRMFSRYKNARDTLPEIDRIRRVADRYGILVVIIDNEAMTAKRRDGLRATKAHLRDFLALCEDAGFMVVRPGNALLRDAIDHAPWGVAPFRGSHASTWVMERTSQAVASSVLAPLREHLRGRISALASPLPALREVDEALVEVFAEHGTDWLERGIEIPADAMQQQLEGQHLNLLVDVARVDIDGQLSAEVIEGMVLGGLVRALVRDPAGRWARTVSMSLVRFDNYDEYGVGVLEGARVIDRRTFDRDGLSAFVAELAVND